jgi:hypothetical protein
LGTALTAGPHLAATATKRKRGGGCAGPAEWRSGPLGRFACAGKEEGKRPAGLGLAGWARRIGREGEGEFVFFFFFQISFKFIFQTFTLKSNKINHAFES